MKRILSVTVCREVDTDPDLSYLGEYSNQYKEGAFDRTERGRNEYRFFHPAMTGEESGNPDSPEQDYQRMEAYNRSEWCMMGVRAVAEVVLTGATVQRIRSGGLWGIESDSDDDYFAEVEQDELSNLRDELLAVGFSARQVATAFKSIEKVEA